LAEAVFPQFKVALQVVMVSHVPVMVVEMGVVVPMTLDMMEVMAVRQVAEVVVGSIKALGLPLVAMGVTVGVEKYEYLVGR